MIIKFVQVTFDVRVSVDESKLNEEFMSEYRQSFYDFFSINDHIKHLAQLKVRGILEPFTEGYGEIKDLGITTEICDQEENIIT